MVQKLLIHNLSLPYQSVSPHLYLFDQNAPFFAGAGDIVMTRALPDPRYLQYLQSIDLLPGNIKFAISTKKPWTDTSLFEDDALLQEVRQYVQANTEPTLGDFFMYTKAEADLVEKLGLTQPPLSRYEEFHTKSVFRSLALEAGLPIPKGYQEVGGGAAVTAAIGKLFLHGAKEVIIKQDAGVAGLGTLRLQRHEYIKKIFHQHSCTPIAGIAEAPADRFVVEEWCQNVITSPSIQMYITKEQEVQILSLHEQLFYPNKQTYRGCRSVDWLDQKVVLQLQLDAKKFGTYLANQGYSGHCTLNAIVTPSGEVQYVELNPRRVMSSYAYQIATRSNPSQQLPYQSLQVHKERWRTGGVEAVLKDLAPWLYSTKTKTGVIPYDLRLLNSHGQITVLVLANDKETVASYIHAIERI